MIKIKMYKANEGDSFLLSFDNENINVLIDVGLEDTYKNHIKNDLIGLNSRGKHLDLLIITHIDNDHIGGAIPLIEENLNNSAIIPIKEVWHNSYRHLQFDKLGVLSPDEFQALYTLKNQNTANTKEGISDIGAKEGSTLASLLYHYSYDWNSSFNNNAVSVENGSVINIGNLKILLLSPNNGKLQKLDIAWKNKLQSIFHDFTLSEDKIFDDAYELFLRNLPLQEIEQADISAGEQTDLKTLAEVEQKDNAPANGSSIAFIMEHGDKKLLFLADAHENIIYESLKALDNKGYLLKFDIVKVSHHGSNKNISKRLIDLIDCDTFLISTNGIKNKSPNIEAIAKILLKESTNCKTLIFNYTHTKLAFLQDEVLKKKYNYEIIMQNEITINSSSDV